MIENFFLQTPVESTVDLSWIAIGIAGISAIGVVGSLLLNWRVVSQVNNRKYAELISKYNKEIDLLINERSNLKDKSREVIMTHIVQYLNKIEEIVFLNSKGKIPYELTIFFEYHIKQAYTILQNIDGKEFDQMVINKKIWQHIIDWCEKYDIKEMENMPIALAKLFKL